MDDWEAESLEVWEADDALVDRDAETRASIRRNRRHGGLAADDATVEWLFRRGAVGERGGWQWLTDAEQAALERREAQLDAGTAAVAAYRDTHREVFAGEWLRWSGGVPTLVLAFTRDVADHRRALAELHPHPDVVEVVERRNTLAALRALLERTEEVVDQLAEFGVAWDGIGIDEENNRIELEIFAPDEAIARRAIADRLGEDVTVVYLGSETTTVETVAWVLWSVDDGGRQLTVHYATNATYERHSVAHEEDEHSVKVTVFEVMPAGSTRLPGATRSATVDLSRPLGDRVVIDGSTGDERPQKQSTSRPR